MTGQLTAICFLLLLTIGLYARFKVGHSKRGLVTTGKKPFFWLGNTVWELFDSLTRYEANSYRQTCPNIGFIAIQRCFGPTR